MPLTLIQINLAIRIDEAVEDLRLPLPNPMTVNFEIRS